MNNTNFKFPHYLGYGILKQASYERVGDVEKVTYGFLGKPIMYAEVSSEGAKITMYYEGEYMSTAYGATLEKAVFQHFMVSDQVKSPLHLGWLNAVTGIGNIYAEMITKEQQRYLYYPAVFLNSIMVPIRDIRKPALLDFITNAIAKRFNANLQQATMITQYPDHQERIEFTLLSLSLPIAFTVMMLKLIKEADLIDNEKRFRALVTQVPLHKNPIVKMFNGAEGDEWKSYSVVYHNQLLQ